MACTLSGGPRSSGPGEEHPESGSEARAPSRPHPPVQHLQPACAGAGAAVMVEALDDAEGLFVAVERCPLCNTARRRLTCARCIQNGDFVYFDGRNPERCVLFFFSFNYLRCMLIQFSMLAYISIIPFASFYFI